MNRTFFRILVLVVCICVLPMLSFAENWACEACGSENNMNFCGNCGAERPKWTCAKCEAQNVGKECAGCGLTHDASEMLTKFDITPQIKVAPILKNGEINGIIYDINGTETAYMGDVSVNAYFVPGFMIENNTDVSQTYSIAMKIAGETVTWHDTIAEYTWEGYYASSTPLAAGTYEYTIYIDGIEVASGQYKLVDGKSQNAPHNYSVYSGLRIKDYETDLELRVGTDTVDVSSLKTNQKYEPVLVVDNGFGLDSLHFRNNAVSAIINNEACANWGEDNIKPNSSRSFRYIGAHLKQGENEIVWFIDGQEVDRYTFTIIGDPSEMGK